LKDPGAQFLPEKKANFKAGPKNHFEAHLPLLSEEALARLQNKECHWVKPATPEGMAVALYRVPDDHSMQVQRPASSIGFFAVVLQGQIEHEGQRLDRHENIFVSSEVSDFTLSAVNGPTEILTLHFPPTDPVYLAA
jgi:hypothetical protein